MTHLQAVRDVLIAAPEAAALVGTRVYPGMAPQGVTRPFVILRLISGVPNHTHTDAPSLLLESARIQVDCYGTEYDANHTVAKAVDNVLGALAGEPLSAVRENQRDDYEDATSLYVVSSDYMVHRTRG